MVGVQAYLISGMIKTIAQHNNSKIDGLFNFTELHYYIIQSS